jgi:hypothetical protein
MKNKKILILCATHGDEGFSIPIVKNLSKRFKFDWLISNPRALKINKRFFEADLNRSGPGNAGSKIYEERRAKKIISIAKNYNAVIDLHGTISNSGLLLILSDPNWQNIELAKTIGVKNVILWPSLKPTGPMSQFISNCLEIECGPKSSSKTAKKLETVLTNYLSGRPNKIKQNIFIVTGKFVQNTKKPMKDFVKFRYKGGSFYPLMVGQYPKIKCYMMQKLSDTL